MNTFLPKPPVALLLGGLLALAFTAQAETVSDNFGADPFVGHSQVVTNRISEDQGPANYAASRSSLSFFNAVGAEQSAIAPSLRTRVPEPPTNRVPLYNLSSPIGMVGYSATTDGYRLEGFSLKGGLTWTTMNDDLTNTGGYLHLTNLVVDTLDHAVYADMNGGNGVGFNEQVKLWEYQAADSNLGVTVGPTPLGGKPSDAVVTLSGQISTLSLTPTAKAMITASLGVDGLEAGLLPLSRVVTWGSLSVPEPGSASLMVLGLAGLAWLRRRQQA